MSKIDRAIKGNLLLSKGFGTSLTLKPLEPEERAVCGFDIEADAITAEPFMLGFSTDTFEGHIALNKPQDVIDLHTRFSFRQSINFYYNLQYDFEGMMKLFNKEVSILLFGSTTAYLDENYQAITHEMKKEDDKKHHFKISYIPKKAFHIKVTGDKKYSYYDLLQYYQMGLNKASKKYLKDQEKDEFEAKYTSKGLFELRTTPRFEILRFSKHIKDNSIFTDEEKTKKIADMTKFFSQFETAEEYREKTIKYCIKDASLCRQLGHIMVDGINAFVNTKNFNSAATISEYYFRSNGISVPKLVPTVFQTFMRSYYGGRFENMKKGYLKNVSIYDIKSAYPFAMADMPILSKNPIIKNVYSMNDNALYGSYCISVEIPEDEYISPLAVRESLLYFPNGKFKEYYVDKITLQTLLDNNYDVEIHQALEIYDDKADYRLRELIIKLFNIKEDKKNQPEVVRLAAKIILNSLYGKFIQLVDDTGLEIISDLADLDTYSPAELFNICNRYYKRVHTMDFKTGKLFAPYYAAHITSHTRNYLYKTSQRIGFEKIIGYHTDSIMLQGTGLIETGHELGDWELESLKGPDKSTDVSNAELYLLKSGFYQVSKDGLTKIRARGVGSTNNLLQNKFTVRRRLGLKQAIRKNFLDMNIISDQSVDNNIDADAKRVWNDSINMEEVIAGKSIDSMPRVIDSTKILIDPEAPLEVNRGKRNHKISQQTKNLNYLAAENVPTPF